MFMRFHHRHGRPDFGGPPHWSRWLRGKHGPFGAFEWANERRARRGFLKFIILSALSERPMHGYDIMQSLAQRHEGRYRPSPGSVYPTLQMLEDGGFVTSSDVEGKRVYTISDAGRKLLAEGSAVDHDEADDATHEDWHAARESARKLIAAIHQGLQDDDPAVREQIRTIIDEARKKIYKALADQE